MTLSSWLALPLLMSIARACSSLYVSFVVYSFNSSFSLWSIGSEACQLDITVWFLQDARFK